MSSTRFQVGASSMVLRALKDDLCLERAASPQDAVALVASVVRRLCGFMCPCPQSALATAAKRSLRALPDISEKIDEVIAAVLEDLLVGGDLIELAQVALTGLEEKPTWLFCAPPSFLKSAERLYIFGIAPDDAPFLPARLLDRLRYDGSTRFIDATTNESLDEVFASLGLRRLVETTWLSKTSIEAPGAFIERVVLPRIRQGGLVGAMPGVSVLRHADSIQTRYRDRWALLEAESGLFIGRMEQPYGAPLWYVMDLHGGQVERALVLPFYDIASRACDQAWRIQLAIDAHSGHPASYSMRNESDGCRIDSSFPLPLSAKRRLLYLGGMTNHQTRHDGSFWIPFAACETAERFLQTDLWLSKSDLQST